MTITNKVSRLMRRVYSTCIIKDVVKQISSLVETTIYPFIKSVKMYRYYSRPVSKVIAFNMKLQKPFHVPVTHCKLPVLEAQSNNHTSI